MANLILIPAFNEAKAIGQTLENLNKLDFDIIVINDGSTDSTGKIVSEAAENNPRIQLLSLPLNSGIGAAVQTGLLYARDNQYDYAIQFDGDGQHDAACIEPMLEHAIQHDLSLCIGSRFLDKKSFTSSALRQVGIRFFARLIGSLSSAKVTDPTSGFRVYGPQVIARFAEHYPDDYPEPEALFWCARNGMKVGEYPVTMRDRQGGQSSIRYLNTVYYMLKVSFAILIDRLRRKEL